MGQEVEIPAGISYSMLVCECVIIACGRQLLSPFHQISSCPNLLSLINLCRHHRQETH